MPCGRCFKKIEHVQHTLAYSCVRRMILCMRTTLDLDDHLLQDARTAAVKSGRTLTSLIEDALRAALAKHRDAPPKKGIVWPSFNSGGLQPGVDLDNSAALLELMEEDDAPV